MRIGSKQTKLNRYLLTDRSTGGKAGFSLLHVSQQRRLTLIVFASIVAIALIGGAPVLLLSLIGGITVASFFSRSSANQLLDRFAMSVGGWKPLFLILATAAGLTLLLHGQPAHALFDGAKEAASSGIGTYIGEEESVSLIDTITFGMWALAAVGGIAVIAGGAAQNIQVLIGGLVLFFGMAVLIGVLEFTDSLLFSS